MSTEPHAARSGAAGPFASAGAATLSVAIVCKNNEATIGRTLGSVRGLATEIVALDNGSTDGTIALLEAAGARIQRVQWEGYVKTKQRAIGACTGDWVLLLDSDESVEADLGERVRGVLGSGVGASGEGAAGIGGYAVNRKVWYAGRFLHHAWQPEWRVRLVRGDLVRGGKARIGGVDPHDEVVVEGGRVERLAGTLRHDTIASMPRFLGGQLRFAEIGAGTQAARGKRGNVWRVITSPTGAFLKQIVLRSAWRDGWRGWAAAGATACHALMKHLILLERTRGGDGESREGGP